MRFLFPRFDIPFAADDAHRFLPWLIGVMACLVTLLLCLGITVNSWIIDQGRAQSSSFTVNIPSDANDLANTAAKVHDTLKYYPGIKDVNQLSEGKLRDMLKSWLSSSDSLDDLPLPVVFEVTMKDSRTRLDFRRLQESLATLAPDIEIDAHERWAEAFSNFSATVQCLMLLLATLILVAMGAMIAFTSRASLKLHAKVVHLLHAIGAEDEYITRQFQQEAFLLVLPGALCGALAAGVIYWATGLYMASLPVSLLPSLTLSLSHFALLALMPPACSIAAWLVARHSVTQQLLAQL